MSRHRCKRTLAEDRDNSGRKLLFILCPFFSNKSSIQFFLLSRGFFIIASINFIAVKLFMFFKTIRPGTGRENAPAWWPKGILQEMNKSSTFLFYFWQAVSGIRAVKSPTCANPCPLYAIPLSNPKITPEPNAFEKYRVDSNLKTLVRS